MKRLIIILACMAGCIAVAQAQLFPVLNRENERNVKEGISPMQYSLISPKKSIQGNTLFPLEGLYYYGELYHCPYDSAIGVISYKYHEDLTLSEVYYDVFPHVLGLEAMKQELNNTFVMEGKDMPDTTTYYRMSNGIYTPYDRYYHNYHYYDKFETDSFFYERTKQRWDPVNNEWINIEKRYESFADTVLWNQIRYTLYDYNKSESDWEPVFKFMDSLIYDERGFVIARISLRYIAQTGATDYTKYEYYLNEDGSIYAIDIFLYQNNEWNLAGKWTDITWALWLGYGGFDVYSIANIDYVPINGKRNKQTSKTGWVKNGDKWEWVRMDKRYWNIDDYGSNIDTIFSSLDGGKTVFPYSSTIYHYDKYGNQIENGYVFWKNPDEQGNQQIDGGNLYKSRYLYGDNGWYKFEQWAELFDPNLYQWDSLTVYKEEVTKWGDPFNAISELSPSNKHSLAIAPNPVSGIVTISATAEIEKLNIFDVMGRLVNSQLPANRQVIFDTGVLPKGVYLVQVRLKDGGVQTGKLVVR